MKKENPYVGKQYYTFHDVYGSCGLPKSTLTLIAKAIGFKGYSKMTAGELTEALLKELKKQGRLF